MAKLLRLGAFLLGGGALLWAGASLAAGDSGEAVWCGLVGVGWTVLGAGLLATGLRRRVASAAGLALAAIGATHWMAGALAAGAPLSAWVLYGAGVDLAALAGLLWWPLPRWRAGLAWAFPAGLALVLAAGLRLATAGGDALNLVAVAATAAGAGLAALRPGPAFARALAPASPQGTP